MRRLGLAALGLLFACGSTQPAEPDGHAERGPARDTTPPVLSVPVIDLSALTEFVGFGAENVGGPQAGGSALVPAWELRTEDRELTVRAACAGEIVEVFDNPREGDAEIHIAPVPDSVHLVIHDHVREVRVSVGERVAAGDVLGAIGWRGDTQGRTELQVNRDDGDASVALCPSRFGTPSFNAAHESARASAISSSPTLCVRESVAP
jgi:hypothetical protein